MEHVTIKKNHDRRMWMGHHWVFSNELEYVPKFKSGETVEVFNASGRSYGCGFFNPTSLISVRLLFTDHPPSKELFKYRLQNALDLRRRLFPGSNVYRLVFGESDFMPGLIIDRYGDYVAEQHLSAGVDKWASLINECLLEIIPDIKGIYVKNTSNLRALEGLSAEEKILYGEIPDVFQVEEEGVTLNISITTGQKTGYFLDQRLNRKFVRSISKNLKVLDCYTNQGGFALNAALGGAKEVTAVDISATALEQAKMNLISNGISNYNLVCADVPEFLESQIANHKRYDLIVLDPPAFAKHRNKLPVARAAYAKINRQAMKLLTPGGFLVSSSCSQQVEEGVFLELITKEAAKLDKQLRLVFHGNQSPCHPILISMPETKYLKFFIFQVI